MNDNNEYTFPSEKGLIAWLSAYFSPPGSTASHDEYRKNLWRWMRFFDSMRISTGKEPIWSEEIDKLKESTE